jgi:hypothetical protein
MSHPGAPVALLQLASQDMHMLSHQVGASSRADLARLATLEDENRALRERLEEQHARSTAQLAATRARIAALELSLAEAAGNRLRLDDAERALRRLREGSAPDAHLARRLMQSEARCRRLELALEELQQRLKTPAAVTQEPEAAAAPERSGEDRPDLAGRRVLYVGGRTGLVERYRALVERHGAELLHHDGGLEASLQRLHPLLAAADLVVCAAGETSHAAYFVVKRFCKRSGKPCALLRRASLASLADALRAFAGGAAFLRARSSLLARESALSRRAG